MNQKSSFIPFTGGGPPPLEPNQTPAPDPPPKADPPQPIISLSVATVEMHIRALQETIAVIRDPAPDRSPRRLRMVKKLRTLIELLTQHINDAEEAARIQATLTDHPDSSELTP